ncbi:MAG: hypothetical protein WBD31_27560 [Rubripirellula sp.]
MEADEQEWDDDDYQNYLIDVTSRVTSINRRGKFTDKYSVNGTLKQGKTTGADP